MATTATHNCANVPAMPSMSSRLRVMPCWKMTTGQPLGGVGQPLAVFGMLAMIGMFCWLVATGVKLVALVVLRAISPPLELCQESVSAAVGFDLLGAVR